MKPTSSIVVLAVSAMSLAGLSCAQKVATEAVVTPEQAAAFRADMAILSQAGTLSVPGKKPWLFQASELRFLGHETFWGEAAASVSRASKPESADPIPAIVDFHQSLAAHDISLILVPVPPKAVVFPDQIGADRQPLRYDLPTQAFYAELRGQGVHVLDLTDPFLAQRESDVGPIYCMTDTHWSPRGAEVAAASIAEQIRSQPWYGTMEKQTYATSQVTREVTGDLVEDPGHPTESLHFTLVGDTPLASDEASPVILMGDSHTLVFNDGMLHGDRAGLADHLANELGMPLDLSFRNKGSGSTQVRLSLFRKQVKSRRDGGDYLGGKKVVVWCFTAREFSESTSGWRVLPLEK
jgi:alginate O-acetyltransferase complex protein AlgJ